MTRADVARLTDLELRVCADGLRLGLSRAWGRGEAGSATSLFDLALVTAEGLLRGENLRPINDVDQLDIWREIGLRAV